jgi:hypothetical protein
MLILKRASASRSVGEWTEDDYDLLAGGDVVGRIFRANASPVGASRMWTLAFGHHEDRTPTHGYEPTREAAMSREELEHEDLVVEFKDVTGKNGNGHATNGHD